MGVSGCIEAGRECRYSGARGYRWHQGAPRGYQGVLGPSGGVGCIVGWQGV